MNVVVVNDRRMILDWLIPCFVEEESAMAVVFSIHLQHDQCFQTASVENDLVLLHPGNAPPSLERSADAGKLHLNSTMDSVPD